MRHHGLDSHLDFALVRLVGGGHHHESPDQLIRVAEDSVSDLRGCKEPLEEARALALEHVVASELPLVNLVQHSPLAVEGVADCDVRRASVGRLHVDVDDPAFVDVLRAWTKVHGLGEVRKYLWHRTLRSTWC